MKIILATICMLFFLSGCLKDYKNPNSTFSDDDAAKSAPDGLSWTPYLEQSLKDVLGKRPVVIYFWAEWCAPCHQLRKLTFTNGEVKTKLSEFVLFKIDATDEKPATAKLQAFYKVESLPVVIFYDKNGKMREDLKLTGFEPPVEFLNRLQKL